MHIQSTIQNHKIMSMKDEKRQKILTTAIEEFAQGFKVASTDTIAKKSGISKGLLFHYFSTKQEFYTFTCIYALETLTEEFKDILQMPQGDLLDRIWQMILRKRELCQQYPKIFELLTMAYQHSKEEDQGLFLAHYQKFQAQLLTLLYQESDQQLLKENINPVMASNIIRWTLNGLLEQMLQEKPSFQKLNTEFDTYMNETKQYLDLLRKMLYC